MNTALPGLFSRENLFAWCVASHDAANRSPQSRSSMLWKLGFTTYAWGNRAAGADFLPQFEEEMDAIEGRKIRLIARWVPAQFEKNEMKLILDALDRRELKPELWISGWDSPSNSTVDRLGEEISRISPFARAAKERGMRLALYNHDGWFGSPYNRLLLLERLRDLGHENVGIVQNLHWGHDYLDQFEEILGLLKPHLTALVLNGTERPPINEKNRILPIGAGSEDMRIIKIIAESGWSGPVGIMNHADVDAESRLLDNLEGLAWLVDSMNGVHNPPVAFRTWQRPVAS